MLGLASTFCQSTLALCTQFTHRRLHGVFCTVGIGHTLWDLGTPLDVWGYEARVFSDFLSMQSGRYRTRPDLAEVLLCCNIFLY